MTVMSSLCNIAKQRPAFFGRVVQAFETLHGELYKSLHFWHKWKYNVFLNKCHVWMNTCSNRSNVPINGMPQWSLELCNICKFDPVTYKWFLLVDLIKVPMKFVGGRTLVSWSRLKQIKLYIVYLLQKLLFEFSKRILTFLNKIM
jgi:hypothetical protein